MKIILPVNILGIEFFLTILRIFLVGPMISRKNPARDETIAIKHNTMMTRIKFTISGVIHCRAGILKKKNQINNFNEKYVIKYI